MYWPFYGTPCHLWAFPLVEIPGPVIWACSIPLGWPSWLPNSWAGTNSLITGFMAPLVLYFMRVMNKMSPLITSNICAGLAFPTPLVHWQSNVFPGIHLFPTGGIRLALLAKDEQLLLGLKCFQKKTRLRIQFFHFKNRSFPM